MHPRDQLYTSLQDLEARASAARRSAGRKSGRDVAAAQALHRWRASAAPDGADFKFSGANIRSWLHPDADRRSVPKDFGKLWALVCVWSEWSGEPPAAVGDERSWWEHLWSLAREADSRSSSLAMAPTDTLTPAARAVATLPPADGPGEASPPTPGGLGPRAVARVALIVLASALIIAGATHVVRQPAEAEPTPASTTVSGTCYGGAEPVAIRDGRSGTATASARCADVNLQVV